MFYEFINIYVYKINWILFELHKLEYMFYEFFEGRGGETG